MKICLLAGRVLAVPVLLLLAASCTGLPGPVNAGDAESGDDMVGYRRMEDVAAFADGSAESAIGLLRAAGEEPHPVYLKLREGSETVEVDGADPLRLPFDAAAGTSPARVVINGGGRTVNLAGAGGSPLLTVGDGVTLTLRDITFTGTGGNNAPLIEINGEGARLVLGTGAVIRGNTNTDTAGGQAGGILVRKGTLELAGGKIIDNNALGGRSAGGVYVAAAGRLTMSGGEISGNSAGITGEGNILSGGGVYADGVFELKGGTLGGNVALGNRGGGAIYVASGGNVVMSGGIIRGGSGQFTGGGISRAIYSGAVYITGGGGVFTMSGGTIEGYAISNTGVNGRVNTCGGGVMLLSGTFNMEGGTISGNSVSADSVPPANAFGGGVYMNGGIFNMEGGTISGNSVSAANAFGGGVYRAGGKFTRTGGHITGNTLESTGSR
jgi:hypothetical protein